MFVKRWCKKADSGIFQENKLWCLKGYWKGGSGTYYKIITPERKVVYWSVGKILFKCLFLNPCNNFKGKMFFSQKNKNYVLRKVLLILKETNFLYMDKEIKIGD